MKLTDFSILKSPSSINQKIFRAAAIVGLLTLCARVGAIFKELVVARSFGRGDALDAFLIAYLLPSFVVLIVMGALGSALVPVLVDIRATVNRSAEERLLGSVLVLSVASLFTLAVLLALFAPVFLPYMTSGFSAAKVLMTRKLLYALLPWVVFSGTTMFITSVLNAGEKFALPAVAPLLTPIITVLFVLFGTKEWGAFCLAAGVVTGSLVEMVFLLFFLKHHGTQLGLKWGGMDPPLRRVLGQYAPLLGGAVLMGSTPLVDQSMAAMLPPGSVSALGYANKVIGGIVALGATALSSATLPYFSQMVSKHDWDGCRHTLKRYSALLVAITLPMAVLLVFFAAPLTRVLFQRGAFSASDTELVARVQSFYALQIPFIMLASLFVRFVSAVGRNDLLLYGTVLNVVLNITLNLVLMRRLGVAGIALSTSTVYFCSCTFLFFCCVRLLAQDNQVHLGRAKST